MTDSEPGFTLETAGDLKDKLETLLNAGKTLDDKDVAELGRVYLEVEKGIFGIRKRIDKDCRHIPPWNRLPNQILRDIQDTDRFTLDESGLAERFAEEVNGWLVYDPSEKRWYVYDTDHWTDTNGDLLAYRTTQLLYKQLEYETPNYMRVDLGRRDRDGKQTVKITVDPKLGQLSSHAARIHTRDLVLRAAATLVYHTFTEPDGIPFKNGLYNIETGVLTPLSPELYNRTVCTVSFNPDTPVFEPGVKFFDDISCHDPEWTHSLFRLIGEALRRGNPNHMLLVFYGSGNNGKGVFVDWLFRALGSLIADCAPEEISRNNKDGRQTSIYDNIGIRLIIVFKETGGLLYDDDVIKRMTGEIRAIWKRILLGAKEIEHTAAPILITNNLPTVENGGKSMVRRQYGVSFDMDLDDGAVDDGLLDKLATPEGNVWLISQIIKTLQEDRQAGKYKLRQSMCPRIRLFTEELLRESDPVYQFISECLEITNNTADKITRNDLYVSFQGFAYSPNGVTPTPDRKFRITPKKFGERLRGHRIRPMDRNVRITPGGNPVRNVYTGIRLSPYGMACVGLENPYYVFEAERVGHAG